MTLTHTRPCLGLANGPEVVEFGLVEEELRRLQLQHTRNPISVRVRFDLYAFFRMLTKIAHSFVVGEIGIENFDPELPEFILGRNPDLVSYLIGGSRQPGQNFDPRIRHQIWFKTAA